MIGQCCIASAASHIVAKEQCTVTGCGTLRSTRYGQTPVYGYIIGELYRKNVLQISFFRDVPVHVAQGVDYGMGETAEYAWLCNLVVLKLIWQRCGMSSASRYRRHRCGQRRHELTMQTVLGSCCLSVEDNATENISLKYRQVAIAIFFRFLQGPKLRACFNKSD